MSFVQGIVRLVTWSAIGVGVLLRLPQRGHMHGDPERGEKSTPLGWEPATWVAYYAQCREFQSTVALKFINLITQASVFTTAVCAGLFTLHGAINSRTGFFFIALVACFPLVVFLIFLRAYHKQVNGAGNVLREIESRLGIPDRMALLTTLRGKDYAFYSTRLAKYIALAYPSILAAFVLGTALVLAFQSRPSGP
jgi:hypothetical protein